MQNENFEIAEESIPTCRRCGKKMTDAHSLIWYTDDVDVLTNFKCLNDKHDKIISKFFKIRRLAYEDKMTRAVMERNIALMKIRSARERTKAIFQKAKTEKETEKYYDKKEW